MKKIGSLSIFVLLVGCGGGGGGTSIIGNGSSGTNTGLPASSTLANLCVAPRSNTSDRQGTLNDEKAYLRSFVDETYLWYNEVPTNLNIASYSTAQDYFLALKTSAKTSSGKDKDQFHWSQTTASWDQQSSGISEDYGIDWAAQSNSPPRNWIVAAVTSNSPAALAGIKRGDKLTSVDGVDFANGSDVDALNNGLFPSSIAAHSLGFNGQAAISLTPATITTITVQNVKIIPTANGKVGYFTFDTHIAKSEQELITAINQLKAANVTDLVIDLRYNGGGLLYIASELAYMVAGTDATKNKVFEKLTYNDKLTGKNEVYPFYSNGTTSQPLPFLGLKKVTILTSHSTASASESIINGLRGVDVDVTLIGDTTRGKPYGFVPQDNCSYTYFSIQFKGVNEKGFGDYPDGFAPTCKANDDFSHQLGDPLEGQLAAALSYRATGSCPAVSVKMPYTIGSSSDLTYQLVRPASKEMRILGKMPKL